MAGYILAAAELVAVWMLFFKIRLLKKINIRLNEQNTKITQQMYELVCKQEENSSQEAVYIDNFTEKGGEKNAIEK